MSVASDWNPSAQLVDLLLEEQRMPSAVDDFAAYHEIHPSETRRYEALIPGALPGDREQFAFRVDLDACTGCKACVTACHSLNGLEEDETWRRVGLLDSNVGSSEDHPSIAHQQSVTAACHHCEEPACLSGCPVRAYEKDEITGIVRHLDDQCIGCRYCQLMCPYDVPTYSARLGIVRKCDMCRGRLSEGEAPACVQGCPNEAISIQLVPSGRDGSESGRLLDDLVEVGAMPESSLTRPTTRYVSKGSAERDPLPLSVVGDAQAVPRHAHTPLAIMLVLTQASVGAVGFDALLLLASPGTEAARQVGLLLATLAPLLALPGLAASALHLGRPQWAFRAILGLRTSWMSREILVLGAFAALMTTSCVVAWIDWMGGTVWGWHAGALRTPLSSSSAVVGLLGIYCSIKIYAVTGRPLWRFDRTAIRFASTAAWAGVAAVHLALVLSAETTAYSPPLAQVALVLLIALATGFRLRRERTGEQNSIDARERFALERTKTLLATHLHAEANARTVLLGVAGLVLPSLALGGASLGWTPVATIVLSVAILILGLASDLLERRLFFRSEAMPAMSLAG